MNKFKITATKDLFNRAAVELVQLISTKVKGSIYLDKNGRLINFKSLLGLLSAGVKENEELLIAVDEDENINEIEKIFIDFFNK